MARLRTPLLAACATLLCCVSAWAQMTVRGSVTSSAAQGNGSSFLPALSSDGRYLAFTSVATNLVPGDANAAEDVFVHDFLTGVTERVSLDSSGVEGDADSIAPSISDDGRFVAFSSLATNLVAGDTNAVSDVFVHDRLLDTTIRASVDSSGVEGNDESTSPMISGLGLTVVFRSAATNLVAGDTNAKHDIFVRELVALTTDRVSIDSASLEANAASSAPSISTSGRYVAFQSTATNLVVSDINGKTDVFVRDRLTNTTEIASVDSSAAQGDGGSTRPAISGDGQVVAFESSATNLVAGDTNVFDDIFVRDRLAATTERVSVDTAGVQSGAASSDPALSSDGRYVAFASVATNLVTGDTNGVRDVFVRDRVAPSTERVSVDSLGAQVSIASDSPWISGDGRFVAFSSNSPALVLGDTNLSSDDFLRDRTGCTAMIASYCTPKVNSLGCSPFMNSSGSPSASAGSGFLLGAEQVLAAKAGLFFYGVSGPNSAPFQGGVLCVAPQTKRTPLQTSTSAGAPPCTGLYSFDFNLHIAGGSDPTLVVGRSVWCQYWTRDSGVLSGTGLTNAMTFVICN